MICSFLVTTTAQAQSATIDYFAGKWEILIPDVQGTDLKLTLTLAKADGKLEGKFTAGDEGEMKINSIETIAEPVSVRINVTTPDGNYDLDMYLKKKDDNNITGDLVNMFDLTGKRLAQ